MQEPSPDAILEIPATELQHFFYDLIEVFNELSSILKDHGILRRRELAELTAKASHGLKATGSPTDKLLILNAYIKQQISHIRKALEAMPKKEQGLIRQAISKIQLRATAIVDHIRAIGEGKKEVSFNSGQARQYIAGREGKPPSRRDTIRAMRKAERLCPALQCGHTPGDGRQTMRLTAKTEDLRTCRDVDGEEDRTSWQRSKLDEVKVIFGFGKGFHS